MSALEWLPVRFSLNIVQNRELSRASGFAADVDFLVVFDQVRVISPMIEPEAIRRLMADASLRVLRHYDESITRGLEVTVKRSTKTQTSLVRLRALLDRATSLAKAGGTLAREIAR